MDKGAFFLASIHLDSSRYIITMTVFRLMFCFRKGDLEPEVPEHHLSHPTNVLFVPRHFGPNLQAVAKVALLLKEVFELLRETKERLLQQLEAQPVIWKSRHIVSVFSYSPVMQLLKDSFCLLCIWSVLSKCACGLNLIQHLNWVMNLGYAKTL